MGEITEDNRYEDSRRGLPDEEPAPRRMALVVAKSEPDSALEKLLDEIGGDVLLDVRLVPLIPIQPGNMRSPLRHRR